MFIPNKQSKGEKTLLEGIDTEGLTKQQKKKLKKKLRKNQQKEDEENTKDIQMKPESSGNTDEKTNTSEGAP